MNANATTVGFVILLMTPIVTLLSSLAKQNQWPKQANALVAMAVSLVGGGIIVVMTGGFTNVSDPANWASVGALVYTASQIVYHTLFKDSTLDTVLANWPPLHKVDPGPAPVFPPQPQWNRGDKEHRKQGS